MRKTLIEDGILSKDRQTIHVSRVGYLEIDGGRFAVIDVMELVPGATTPRGFNRIVVLDSSQIPVQQIEYTTERPLYCEGNQLVIFGDLAVDNHLPEGNVLTFTDGGRKVLVSHVDMNNLPGKMRSN